MRKHVLLLTISLIAGFGFTKIQGGIPHTFAQSIVPSTTPPFYPLAPCPTCTNPSIVPLPSASSSPVQPNNPTGSMTNPQDPCSAESAAIAHDRRHHGHHKKKQGFFSKNIEKLMKLLLELINKLLSLFGMQPIENPNQEINDPNDDNPQPTPCPEKDDDEQTPDITTVPQPLPTVPGISTAPLPSTVVPSNIAPSGTPISGCTQADIQKLVDSVSQANIEKNLKALVQDDSKPTPNELISRHVSSPGNQIKVDWAKKQLTSNGLQIVEQSFTSGGKNLHNVIARVNGTDQNAIYAVGAHIDSISENPETLAPGADDDGSGVVVVMEVARVLKGYERCLKSSVDFIGFNDEEEEMNGSATYVESLSGKTVKGAYNMDMVGYAPSTECLKSDVKESARDQVLAQKMVDVNTKYNIGLNVTTGTYTQNEGDDLAAFWNANYPGAYLIECTTEKDPTEYPDYHKTTDTTKGVNFAQLTKVAKILVAGLAELASQ